MQDTCYHCGHALDNAHLVTFYRDNDEHDELLCDQCYREWLESIKD